MDARSGSKLRIQQEHQQSLAAFVISPFVNHGFIADQVVQFLGVRSLVRFGAVSKNHKLYVDNEIDRRKKLICDIETKVKRLLKTTLKPEPGVSYYFENPSRDDVLLAQVSADNAKRWIDDEVCLHEKMQREVWEETNTIESVCTWDKLFQDERKLFLISPTVERRWIGSLYVPPLCFFVPPVGELTELKHSGYNILGTNFRLAMRAFKQHVLGKKDFSYEEVLKQFENPDQNDVGLIEIVNFARESATIVSSQGGNDSFRKWARLCFYKPYTRQQHLLRFIIEEADLYAAVGH